MHLLTKFLLRDERNVEFSLVIAAHGDLTDKIGFLVSRNVE